jgi:metal-responsive CopG/Arc/MetJ family transcriptional regulator
MKRSPIGRLRFMSAAPARAKKITVDIPLSLYEETQEVLNERQITTSVFVREAMERYLEGIKQKKLERELAEGYVAHAALSQRIHDEFEFVDAEQS